MNPQMKTKSNYSIVLMNNKFVVTKDGQPINLPLSNGSSILAQFDSEIEAQEYLSILKNLIKSNYK